MKTSEIFISGYARLPQGITAEEMYTVMVVGMVVDKDTGLILDVECSLVTDLAKKFIKDLLVGKSLEHISEIEEALTLRYFGSARKALISAIKIAYEKYRQILSES
ncbi:DUF3870 domain-containing protein [Acidaminobacter hydrogenoformans]|uniref:DUF3870 domain-containing protein n=1 Tax=Acidaminobacter hydrogenoformans DSM 2784 TaxID=1120920 RepID=A0A1G5RPR8_9FIRM|nr:DUF3870 domain-containing protein [Acidaminobacter hydrogenoformans]SCZ75994.1 protein of unknown function [Acidaminobacter hydrogenoformans DSM 2784]